MTIPPAQMDPPTYEPTSAQLERAESFRRFNWLYVYIPVGLVSLAVFVLIALLLWGALSPNITGTREFASGLADIAVILAIVPMLLLCAIVLAAAIGLLVYRRQQPKQEYGRFQTLFWRLDTLVNRMHGKVKTALPRTANPIIGGHARITYWRTLVGNIKKIFTRR